MKLLYWYVLSAMGTGSGSHGAELLLVTVHVQLLYVLATLGALHITVLTVCQVLLHVGQREWQSFSGRNLIECGKCFKQSYEFIYIFFKVCACIPYRIFAACIYCIDRWSKNNHS